MTANFAPLTTTNPFGRPLFNDPSVRKLARVGVVDIGSNSVRMVVFDGAARSPAYFYNEKVMCALGAGISDTGRLNPEGRVRALAAVARFEAIAQSLGISPLTAVATAAVRDASDGPDFCANVLRETGLRVQVIDGPEEARLSAQGVLLGFASYGTFRAWPAYKYSVEHTVYVHKDHRGKGLGLLLMIDYLVMGFLGNRTWQTSPLARNTVARRGMKVHRNRRIRSQA